MDDEWAGGPHPGSGRNRKGGRNHRSLALTRAILEFLLGCDADVAQDGAGEFGKEALHEIEPGTVLGSESKFEAVGGTTGEPGSGLFGDMRRMIVVDQVNRRLGRL
jgi:hypothetical protein